jgi:hypothetical protein
MKVIQFKSICLVIESPIIMFREKLISKIKNNKKIRKEKNKN